MKATDLTIVKVFHDGQEKARFEGKEACDKALGYILKNQSMSVSWALENEGWLVQQFHEKGNFYWTPKNYGI